MSMDARLNLDEICGLGRPVWFQMQPDGVGVGHFSPSPSDRWDERDLVDLTCATRGEWNDPSTDPATLEPCTHRERASGVRDDS